MYYLFFINLIFLPLEFESLADKASSDSLKRNYSFLKALLLDSDLFFPYFRRVDSDREKSFLRIRRREERFGFRSRFRHQMLKFCRFGGYSG